MNELLASDDALAERVTAETAITIVAPTAIWLRIALIMERLMNHRRFGALADEEQVAIQGLHTNIHIALAKATIAYTQRRVARPGRASSRSVPPPARRRSPMTAPNARARMSRLEQIVFVCSTVVFNVLFWIALLLAFHFCSPTEIAPESELPTHQLA